MKSKGPKYLGIGVLSMACGSEPKLDVHPSAAQQVDAVPEELGRPHRRMNVDQLKTAMEQVSGGIGWTEVVDGEAVDLFDQLSVTLGRPDYLASTHEELAPGLLFQKFLEDASRSICPTLAEPDPQAESVLTDVYEDGPVEDSWTRLPIYPDLDPSGPH